MRWQGQMQSNPMPNDEHSGYQMSQEYDIEASELFSLFFLDDQAAEPGSRRLRAARVLKEVPKKR